MLSLNTCYCEWCSNPHDGLLIYHHGICPKVKKIEYHENGVIKSIEFNDGMIADSVESLTKIA